MAGTFISLLIDGDPRGRKELASTASLNLFGALLNSIHDLQSVLLLLGRQPTAHNWIIDCRIVFRFCSGPGGRDQTCQIGAPQSDAATPNTVGRNIALPDPAPNGRWRHSQERRGLCHRQKLLIHSAHGLGTSSEQCGVIMLIPVHSIAEVSIHARESGQSRREFPVRPQSMIRHTQGIGAIASIHDRAAECRSHRLLYPGITDGRDVLASPG
jgi:hypothetical protein